MRHLVALNSLIGTKVFVKCSVYTKDLGWLDNSSVEQWIGHRRA